MSQDARDYVVLTYAQQPSIADFLKRLVDSVGFASLAASSPDELETLIQAVVPDAVVYEVAFPFGESWHRLTQLRNRPEFRSIPFVVTTPDAPELYRRVGVRAMELFRKPDDLNELKQVVLGAIGAAA